MSLSLWSYCAAPLLVLALVFALRFVEGADKYENYADLAANETEGVDYRIVAVDRGSDTLILAIHGGEIERYTSELTVAAAGSQFNYYLFEGIKSMNNRELHITSTKFDEPQALALVAKADVCVTLHGSRERDVKQVCVGGGNCDMKQKFLAAAACETSLPFHLLAPCERLPGKSPNNIVNKCSSDGGLQLELSTLLRDAMKDNPGSPEEAALLRMIAKAVAPDPVMCPRLPPPPPAT